MSKIGSWIAGGNSTVGRINNDFYPTPSSTIKSLFPHITLPDTVWEPACGDGAISKEIIKLGKKVVSTDLNDYGYGRSGVDFLKQTTKLADCIITNPPFNLAEKFIIKCKELDILTFAMILKSQYFHACKRIKLFNEVRPSKILAMTWRPDFLGKGSPTMDCIWAVWEKGSNKTEYYPIERVD